MDNPSASRSGPPFTSTIVERYEQSCRSGEGPDLASFVASAATIDPRELAALVHADQRHRHAAGIPLLAESYLQSFPALQSDTELVLDVVYQEYVLKRDSGEAYATEKYLSRFPDLAEQLGMQFELDGAMGDELPSRSMVAGQATGERSLGYSPGTVIAERYKLLEEIGEGGMGTVWVAQQIEPVRRRVALKLIKPGMDSRQVLSRFEIERQALAMMDHPHIAKVLDGGVTDHGRPYFVMEYVKGEPITDYCDNARLSVKERLNLFVQVCHAVQHAHQKGIIHRDLKPSNILVCPYDGRPVPKVIDFGLAKAIHQPLTAQSLYTTQGVLVGTPMYMSPEQAETNNLDVDTRSDLYSLGVILYELLTGSTPLEKRQLQDAAFQELLRLIQNEEPPRPSTRLTGSGLLPTIAFQRSLQPAQLGRLIKGDLDWIVMKSLEKDRSRRYETANGLALDIERYLHDEPVLACPPSTWYRMRKWASRNKGLFASATVAATVVLLGLVTLLISNFLIRQEQSRTKFENQRAEQAQRLAETRAEEIRQGLQRLKDANAWLDRGRQYIDGRQWDDANAAFSKAVKLRPDHLAASLERGELYARLGLWELASADFTRAYELREPDATMLGFRHALLSLYLGNTAGYRQIRARMKDRFRGTLHERFTLELIRSCALGSDTADRDLEQSVELAQNCANAYPGVWFNLYVLGMAQYRAGRHEQAVANLRRSLTATPEWSMRALSYPILAMALHKLGQNVEAGEALRSTGDTIDRWTEAHFQRVPGVDWEGVGAPWEIPWWDWIEVQIYYREAKQLIDHDAPTEDARLHVVRARAFAALRQNVAADVEYAIALEQFPDNKQLRLEAHRSAGYTASARQDWNRTATEFTKASELAPDDWRLLEFQALALLAAGNVEGYRQSCLKLWERFEKTNDSWVAGDLVFTCALRSDTLPEMHRLVPLARVAAPFHHRTYIPGIALYRADQYDEAIQWFDKAAKLYRPGALEWIYLAMAHHRLGHGDQANRCLTEAIGWIDAANRPSDDDPSGTKPTWTRWYEPVIIPRLLQEAQTLLQGTATQKAIGNSH